MDFDKLRSQWTDPEYKRSLADVPREPRAAIIERMIKMDKRDARWRLLRQVLMKVSIAGILCLASVQLFVIGKPEHPMQVAGFMMGMLAMSGLNLVVKARTKNGNPRYWLTPGEFLIDERRRLAQAIRLDRWTTALLSVGILSLALYASPYLRATARPVCWAAAGLAIAILQGYDCRKISYLKRMRENLEPQPEDPEDDEDCT